MRSGLTIIMWVISLHLIGCEAPSPPAPITQPKALTQDRAPSQAQAAPPAGDDAAEPQDSPAHSSPRQDFAELVEQARPSVINIYTKTQKQRAAQPNSLAPLVPQERLAESLGSGFIMDETGLALTNYHVIRNATDIEVRLLDNRKFKATIVGVDPKTDVALISIQGAQGLPWLKMADSDSLKVGQWALAIGNPLGLTSTVTAGIISAVGRKDVPLSGEMMYQDFIQTDASINPGNSGGPLLDMEGRVVGINTAVSAQGQGIGFAIPINMVRQLLPQLKEHGQVRRSWLGIYVEEVPEALQKELGIGPGGALVMRVVPKGPADLAKLQPGDVIVKFDQQPVPDASKLSWMASLKGIGNTVPIELYRGKQRLGTHLKLGSLPDKP